MFEAAIRSSEGGRARNFIRREHAFNGGGSVGKIADDYRAMKRLEEFQTFLETVEALFIRGAIAVTKPKKKICADHKRGLQLCSESDLSSRFSIRRHEKHRVSEVRYRFVRSRQRGVQIIMETILGRLWAAEQLGFGKTR